MKFRFPVLVLLLFWMIPVRAARVERMDPPFWYTGMKNRDVAVCFPGGKEEGRYTPALPETVVPESKKVSYIDLVPYGSTTLRLTIFPQYQQ